MCARCKSEEHENPFQNRVIQDCHDKKFYLHLSLMPFKVEVNYCPYCGRKLSENNSP